MKNFHDYKTELEEGFSVQTERARVEFVEKLVTNIGLGVRMQVAILDPGNVSVLRQQTLIVKVGETNEVECVIHPHDFLIVLNPDFSIQGTEFLDDEKEQTVEEDIDRLIEIVTKGDEVYVLHLAPKQVGVEV